MANELRVRYERMELTIATETLAPRNVRLDSHLDTVSTTCGSGWVILGIQNHSKYRMLIVDPPATAGGTDCVQAKPVSRSTSARSNSGSSNSRETED